jgi:hypothetical protein
MAENGMRSRVRRKFWALTTGDIIMFSPKARGSAMTLSNGLHFPIRNQDDNIIFCRVTYEALAELAGCDPNMPPEAALEIFEKYRIVIEGKAAELLARGLKVIAVTPALVGARGCPCSGGDAGGHAGA